MCGVSAILTDPGLVCTGDTVLLTCTIPNGITLGWSYDGEFIGDGVYRPPNVPPTNPDTVGGVVFTHSLLSTSPDLLSQLGFTASTDMNGGIIRCDGDFQTSAGGLDSVTDNTTVQVGQLCKSVILDPTQYGTMQIDPAPAELRVVDVVNGSDSSTVTIEWTPPTALVQYTTTTTPVPISPTMSVTTTPPTTDPIQMDIIVDYNVNYTITVSIETCAGPRQTTTTVSILRGTENDIHTCIS